MKDLLVYVADADAEAFIKAILVYKTKALGIREINFDIMRHPQRDNGMIQSGAELVRMYKGKYQKALLLWDHHGSGRDNKQSANQVKNEIQSKLDEFTWKNNSDIIIFVPELEQWLWYCENAVSVQCGISQSDLNGYIENFSKKSSMPVEEIKRTQPKELFESVMKQCKRSISPRDFAEMGKRASIKSLMNCHSFDALVHVLRSWFPA